MRVYFLRHGESVSNADPDRLSLPPAVGDRLTERGVRQAHEAARGLAGRTGAERVLTSPLRRARETAEIVAGELGLPIEVVEDLREYRDSDGYGHLSLEEQRAARWSTWMAEHADRPGHSLRGAESFEEMVARVARIQDFMLARADRSVLAIGHGILTRFFFASAVFGESFGPADVPRLWQLGATNCGLTVFEHGEPDDVTGPAPGYWRCLTWMASP